MMKTCRDCTHATPKYDGAGFITYSCELEPGLVVGESGYLEGIHFREVCDDYKEWDEEKQNAKTIKQEKSLMKIADAVVIKLQSDKTIVEVSYKGDVIMKAEFGIMKTGDVAIFNFGREVTFVKT